MKIGIITFHFVSNAGGILQCYALQKFLSKQGYDVQVIDYRPKYHTVRYTARKNPFIYATWFWKKNAGKRAIKRVIMTVRSFMRCLYLNIKQPDKRKEQLFSSFINEHIRMTQNYSSLQQLRSNPPDADVYITGSDQLWNPELLDFAFDPAYFLQFGLENIPRISYAVSTGKKLNEDELFALRGMCEKLTAISLREYDSKAIEAIGKDVHVCIDPTLLLDADDYASVESKQKDAEPFIFVYGFENTSEIHSAIALAKKKYHCKVINGSPNRIKLGEDAENLLNYGPDRFLTLIKNAQCVVTNSFHGTVFSIIYHKDFITIAHSTRGRRMTSLLSRLELTCRLWGDSGFDFSGIPNYEAVGKRLLVLRKYSTDFLFAAIDGENGEKIPHMEGENDEISCEHNNLNAYYGYLKDENELRASASGGAATALSRSILNRGGVVFGVEYTEDFSAARFGYAETVEQLNRFTGSKYIYPKTVLLDGRNVFDEVEQKLKDGKQVLFVALGCIVKGLLNRLESRAIDTTNLYTVDLICHGPTRIEAHRAFIEELESRYKAKVSSFSYRYKKNGWSTPYIKATFDNGKCFSKPLYETDVGFALKYYCNESCYNCSFKGNGHAADITIGDFWGIKPGMKEYKKRGVSILLARTEKGEQLINHLEQNDFFWEKTGIEFALKKNPMFSRSELKPAFYNQFDNDLKKVGLHKAVKRSSAYKVYLKAALINRLKRILREK